MTQLLLIHGGSTYNSREDFLKSLETWEPSLEKKIRWYNKYLEDSLGNELEIIKPQMPLREDAKYDEWKIYFEKYIPHMKDNIILTGGSLGGIFLAKYLSENKIPKKILSVYLIAPPFDNSLPGEDLVGGFELQKNLSLIEKNCKNLNLMFSKDDVCVPLSQAEKYKEKLPNANIIIYESKNGHFKIEEFPEIIEMIKNDLKNITN